MQSHLYTSSLCSEWEHIYICKHDWIETVGSPGAKMSRGSIPWFSLHCVRCLTLPSAHQVPCTQQTTQCSLIIFCLKLQKPNRTPILPAPVLCCSVHPIVVQVSDAWPQWWISGQANSATSWATLLAWLKQPPPVLCWKAICQGCLFVV